MDKEDKKEKNVSKKILMIILILILLTMFTGIGYVIRGSIGNKKSMGCTCDEKKEIKEEEKDPNEIVIKKGDCPLYHFEENYALTEEEKSEIIDILKANNHDIDSVVLNYSTDYYIVVSISKKGVVGSTNNAILSKVNQKYKLHAVGGAFTSAYINELNITLENICKS